MRLAAKRRPPPTPAPAQRSFPSQRLPPRRRPSVRRSGSSASHPYLLFDDDDIADFRAQVKQSGHKRAEIYGVIKDAVDDRGSSCPQHGLTAFGFCYAMTGNSSYAESVRVQLLDLAGSSEWEGGKRDRKMAMKLIYFALAYDMCYDYLRGKSGFSTIRNKLARETHKMYEAASASSYNSSWSNWWRHCYSQNHYHRNIAALALGAMALKFEGDKLSSYSQSDVNRWLKFSLEEFKKNKAALDRVTDGSWYEGTQYEQTTMGSDLPVASWALRRVEGYDAITSCPGVSASRCVLALQQRSGKTSATALPRSEMMARPGGRQTGCFPPCDSRPVSPTTHRHSGQRIASSRVHGRQASMGAMMSLHAIVQEFIYYDDGVEPLSHRRSLAGFLARYGHSTNRVHANRLEDRRRASRVEMRCVRRSRIFRPLQKDDQMERRPLEERRLLLGPIAKLLSARLQPRDRPRTPGQQRFLQS